MEAVTVRTASVVAILKVLLDPIPREEVTGLTLQEPLRARTQFHRDPP